MDMDLTPEQDLLRESVRRTCQRHCGMDVVRKLENDPVGYSPALWAALGELGLHGLTVPEDQGGSGMSLLDAAIVYEELGRALVPSPHFVSCVLAAGVLGRLGATDLVSSIAGGERVVSVAGTRRRVHRPRHHLACRQRTADRPQAARAVRARRRPAARPRPRR
jgi:alkylation response protein AidB-like acyl-CoA dehydrogenase